MTETALTTIPEYNATAVALADLRGRMANVVHDVTSTKGMTAAKRDVAELRALWVALETERVRIKAPALERSRQIDAEAKKLEAELKGLAEPIKAQIEAEEQRKEREKAAKEQAERERIEALNARIDAIKSLPLRAVNATVAEIDAVIGEAQEIDLDTFPAELRDAVKFQQNIAIAGLKAARDQRVAHDQEQVRIQQERAELEALRKEQAERQAAQEREAAAQREREAAALREQEEAARVERERVQAAERAERERQEAADREARRIEQERIDAERAERQRIEDEERRAAAEKLRLEQEAAAAERKRLDDERAAFAAAERQREIDGADLLSAAGEAVAFLKRRGFADELITKKLEAAVNREPVSQAA